MAAISRSHVRTLNLNLLFPFDTQKLIANITKHYFDLD